MKDHNNLTLGLDIGTTSIGWALVEDQPNRPKSIKKVGVRIIPLSSDEENDFQQGKSTTLNANRTSKRGMRRNLDRYQLRRKALKQILIEHQLINKDTLLTNAKGKGKSPFTVWELRNKAATEKIELEEFARVLFAINKKRGYKSNRKTKDEGDGQAVDGMDLALHLFENNWTPGQLMLHRLNEEKKGIPDFYRSDLQNEFERVWTCQKEFYPTQLTGELKKALFEKNKKATYALCKTPFQLEGIKRTTKGKAQQLENYQWRVQGLTQRLELEQLAVVLQEINGQISGSSGYLGKISDRSKELYFKKLTVGQYLYQQLQTNSHHRLKGQVFYRQDYMDEFEQLWETQAKFHPKLTLELKAKIRDVIIFYQRRLKSQKGLISICELEEQEFKVIKNGKPIVRVIGPKVCPKSSPLFQEFKIWQKLNDLQFKNILTKAKVHPDLALREALFQKLNICDKLSVSEILKLAGLNARAGWEINFKNGLDGNVTTHALYQKFKQIVEYSGHDVNWDKLTPTETTQALHEIFESLGIAPNVLYLNTNLKGHEFTQQPAYKLWHLLYSYEGDDSKSGNKKLIEKLHATFGFPTEYGKLLAQVVFKDDYGSLSTKAMLKIIPFLKAGNDYSEAAAFAGYKHSKWLTTEENLNRLLDDSLQLFKKNSLRNPIVEKILNQLINLVNVLIEEYGRPKKIRVELARELKKSAKERAEMTKNITSANKYHEAIKNKLKTVPPFNKGVRITHNDVIKYKLWEELADNGFKTLYTNVHVPLEKLYSKDFDIEHIIPKARLFDDSFSNKTISTRDFNLKKGNSTGIDAVAILLGEKKKEAYLERIERLYKNNKISKAKYLKLKMEEKDIPDKFIDRDLRNSQYIAKKATELLQKICYNVVSTTGGVTNRLRQDWQLVNVLQELNWEKYKRLGLVDYEKNKEGQTIGVIKDWTKRNDHRHHIMDAITVAFTHPNHIQYLNYLNARENSTHKLHNAINGIEQKETEINAQGKRILKPPMPLQEFRAEAKRHLESVLVSFKAKNKVTTYSVNVTQRKGKPLKKKALTPRGQLHKETVYGKRNQYVVKTKKVGSAFTAEIIKTVAEKTYREALINRLNAFEGNPKKAFTGKNSLTKKPIYLNESRTAQVPEHIRLVEFEEIFTIRKVIDPDLKVDKVIDAGVRKILRTRLADFQGDAKKAFSNLEEHPIWLTPPLAPEEWEDKDNPKPHELGIPLKRVTIKGVSNAIALHTKKDHLGLPIKDAEGATDVVDYVSTGNNHHVAIYKDSAGKFQEKIVSFFEAVLRKKQGLSVVDYEYNTHLGWQFLFTMKQNEMFVFPNQETDFNPSEIDLQNPQLKAEISPNLFRVQTISSVQYGNNIVRDFLFRHHLDSSTDKTMVLKNFTFRVVKSLKDLERIVKVRINHLGEIVHIGEY